MKPTRLFIILCFFTLPASAQFGMPSYKEVTDYFFTHYQQEEPNAYIRLQRKKDGWFVSLERFEQEGVYTNTKLLWSKQLNSYQETNYARREGDSTDVTEAIERYKRQVEWDFEEYAFNRVLYYNYPGWDWDIINDPFDEHEATDSLLESRARAYSSYASGFVTEQFGNHFENNDPDRVLPPDTVALAKSAIDKLVDYDLKSIGCYEKLLSVNPAYLTKVGNIAIKTANEYMFLYYWLTIAGDSARARQYAAKAMYPDSLLQLNKRLLQAVPKNGILITGGDNDTYTCWYLQEIKQLRTDVTVLNYSLLGLRRQLFWLDKRFHHRLFTTADSIYGQKSFNYSFYSNTTGKPKPMELSSFLKGIRTNHNPYLDSGIQFGVEGIRSYYSKSVFRYKADNKKSGSLSIGDYFLLNDFMLLDIIQTQKTRPVCSTFNIDWLDPWLKNNGVLFTVVY